MRKIVLLAFVMLSSLCSNISWAAPEPVACLTALETQFFDERIVIEALGLYSIPQGLLLPISGSLKQKGTQVPQRMNTLTARMAPNPLDYPINRPIVARLLKKVLYEVYMETMRFYQVDAQPTANWIFAYIFNKQLPNLERCLGKEVRSLAPTFD